MKCKFSILFIALFTILLGCKGKQKPKIEQIKYQSKIFLENRLIEYLNKSEGLQSPDSLKFVKALDSFQRHVKGLSNNVDFLTEFPLQATNIRDTLIGEKLFKMATFETYTDPLRPKESLLNRMKLKVNGIFQFIDESQGLVLGGKYYLISMLYKQGKRADVNYYKKAGGNIYVLGVYPMQVKELRRIVSKEQIASLK
ncbi:MAG: hypothetical protein EOP00_18940 [Pedobacter sp.]|nr:MAG: hypothetical protein EOP00_18940 [Pedobacter sp.]